MNSSHLKRHCCFTQLGRKKISHSKPPLNFSKSTTKNLRRASLCSSQFYLQNLTQLALPLKQHSFPSQDKLSRKAAKTNQEHVHQSSRNYNPHHNQSSKLLHSHLHTPRRTIQSSTSYVPYHTLPPRQTKVEKDQHFGIVNNFSLYPCKPCCSRSTTLESTPQDPGSFTQMHLLSTWTSLTTPEPKLKHSP
ncbi:hypothetical protein KC19_5G097900 [Ceratodon purpureus]|uniref:Uncharacterized protein n=1 Tax=Ceratodon purpureus TaxID=3225 RepID=A0A8T0I0W4_CERPU|nr:hypothetical protein KC19_5G097900 [Ceratodon purpureus]